MTGQRFAGSQADLAMVLLAQAVLNIGRGRGDKPVTLPGPYTGAEAERRAKAPKVSKQVKRELTETLRAYSSIPD